MAGMREPWRTLFGCKLLVAATNGSRDPVSSNTVRFAEKLGADGEQYDNVQSNESVSHRLVDKDIAGSYCTWKKHHGTLTNWGLQVTIPRPPTGAGGRGNEDLMCGDRSKRPVQPKELGRG